MQIIKAKVGDTITLQLAEPVDGTGKTWDIIEYGLGYNAIWNLAKENWEADPDGKTSTRTFSVACEKQGKATLTFVLGDMSKFDDGKDAYSTNADNLFNLDLMDATEFTQIQLDIQPA